jgi:hypothetical protein
MEEALLRVPVACPKCGKEMLTEYAAVPLVQALINGDSIRLYASCHRRVWPARVIGREQLRQYLEAAKLWDFRAS